MRRVPKAIFATAVVFALAAVAGLASCASGAGQGSQDVVAQSAAEDAQVEVWAEGEGAFAQDDVVTYFDMNAEEFADQADVSDAASQSATLAVQNDPDVYSYDDMEADAHALAKAYPQWVRAGSLGTTFDGRQVLYLCIGNPSAPTQVLVTAGTSAQDYATSQMVMKQADAFLSHAAAGDSFDAGSYHDALDKVAIHVVPCVNPDGMAIGQLGYDGVQTDLARERLLEASVLDGSTTSAQYFRTWKANANGVDLNRQYDAMWEEFRDTGHPSAERYKGSAPATEAESRGLASLAATRDLDLVLAYQASGSTVAWYFGQGAEDGIDANESRVLAGGDDSEESGESEDAASMVPADAETAHDIAEAIANQTGYDLGASRGTYDLASFEAWTTQSLAIPTVRIEAGAATAPATAEEFPALWAENAQVWETTLSSLLDR